MYLIIFRLSAVTARQEILPLNSALPGGGAPRKDWAFHPGVEQFFDTSLCPSHPSDSFPVAVDDGIVPLVIGGVWLLGQHEPMAELLFYI